MGGEEGGGGVGGGDVGGDGGEAGGSKYHNANATFFMTPDLFLNGFKPNCVLFCDWPRLAVVIICQAQSVLEYITLFHFPREKTRFGFGGGDWDVGIIRGVARLVVPTSISF